MFCLTCKAYVLNSYNLKGCKILCVNETNCPKHKNFVLFTIYMKLFDTVLITEQSNHRLAGYS